MDAGTVAMVLIGVAIPLGITALLLALSCLRSLAQADKLARTMWRDLEQQSADDE